MCKSEEDEEIKKAMKLIKNMSEEDFQEYKKDAMGIIRILRVTGHMKELLELEEYIKEESRKRLDFLKKMEKRGNNYE